LTWIPPRSTINVRMSPFLRNCVALCYAPIGPVHPTSASLYSGCSLAFAFLLLQGNSFLGMPCPSLLAEPWSPIRHSKGLVPRIFSVADLTCVPGAVRHEPPLSLYALSNGLVPDSAWPLLKSTNGSSRSESPEIMFLGSERLPWQTTDQGLPLRVGQTVRRFKHTHP
jgi:hypothetical protein